MTRCAGALALAALITAPPVGVAPRCSVDTDCGAGGLPQGSCFGAHALQLNGVLDEGERCDDGNDDETDRAEQLHQRAAARGGAQACTWIACWACDDGNTSNTDACLDDCSATATGDDYGARTCWLVKKT